MKIRLGSLAAIALATAAATLALATPAHAGGDFPEPEPDGVGTCDILTGDLVVTWTLDNDLVGR